MLTLAVPAVAFGESSPLGVALLMITAWAINLTVAEWIIRRHPARRSVVSDQLIPVMEAGRTFTYGYVVGSGSTGTCATNFGGRAASEATSLGASRADNVRQSLEQRLA